jgi:FeS assembly SUF system regulator
MVLNRVEGADMLRISKLTDYATVLLAQLSDGDAKGTPRTAVALAERTHIGVATVSKVLKELQRGGLVRSTRGAHGGYALNRPATAISAADIIDAVEGPVGLTECATHPGQCDLEPSCRVGHAWQRVHRAIRGTLQDISLAELIGQTPTSQPTAERLVSLGARPSLRVRI